MASSLVGDDCFRSRDSDIEHKSLGQGLRQDHEFGLAFFGACDEAALKSMGKSTIFWKRVRGIEPLLTAWKAVVLPLNYTRIINRMIKSGISALNMQSIG